MGGTTLSNNWVSSNLGFCLRPSFNVCKIMNKLTIIRYANEEKKNSTPRLVEVGESPGGIQFLIPFYCYVIKLL